MTLFLILLLFHATGRCFVFSRLLTAERTTSTPDTAQRRGEAVTTVGSHGGLDDLEGLAKGGNLEQVQTCAEQQVGELDGLLLERAARDGSFDSGGGDHDFWDVLL